jgi:hypothetical protein
MTILVKKDETYLVDWGEGEPTTVKIVEAPDILGILVAPIDGRLPFSVPQSKLLNLDRSILSEE